jgi:hypothetical protein
MKNSTMTLPDPLKGISGPSISIPDKTDLSVQAGFKQGSDLFPEFPETTRKTGPVK